MIVTPTGNLKQANCKGVFWVHFFIFINDLPDNSVSKVLFADDTSVISFVEDINVCTEEISNDLEKISDWVYQWKMMVSLDTITSLRSCFFSRKTVMPFHPLGIFIEVPAECNDFKKHLDLHLQFFARSLGLIYDR